ncbi:MAG TPA: hypothetical protein VEK15_32015, partial [Vicinamibacteria bacterium]|nr:hypothetical protein [Vicinamibacteria bacterium]
HSLVARKAFRFILPSVILLVVVYAFGLFQTSGTESRVRMAHRRLFVGVHLAAFVFVSFWYPHRGPVEAALTLSRSTDFVDRLVIVDGDEDALGGHYYLRREKLDVSLISRSDLTAWLRRERPRAPLYILVSNEPLPPTAVEPHALELVGEFRNWPDLQRHARRWLYRLRS